MDNRDQLLGAIDSIYDAAAGNVPWNTPLEQMASLLSGQFCALEFVDKSTGQMRSFNSNAAPEINLDYLDEYFKECPRYGVFKPVGSVFTDYDFIDEDGMNRHPFYAEFLGSYNLRYFGGAFLRNTMDDIVAFSVQRTIRQGHLQNDAFRHLEVLVPHLRRATQMSEQLHSVSMEASDYAAGFDRLSDGIVFLNDQGQIVHLNRSAAAMLKESDGLYVASRTLRAAVPEQDAVLSQMTAVIDIEPLADGYPVELAITRPSGLPAYFVSAMPIRPVETDEKSLRGACSVLVIRDPIGFPPPKRETLRQAFGLTDAEASLALALAAGDTPAAYARRARIKMPTVRSQLSAIFRKMQVRRQADIVSLVTRLSAPFRL